MPLVFYKGYYLVPTGKISFSKPIPLICFTFAPDILNNVLLIDELLLYHEY